MASSCCGEVDIDEVVVCAFLRDMPEGVPVRQVGIDAFGNCVTAEAVTTSVSTDADNILVKGLDGGAYLAVADTATVDLSHAAGTLSADVKVSTTPPAGGFGNPIQVLPDGLRIIAREAADWEPVQDPAIPPIGLPPCSLLTMGDVVIDSAGFLKTAPTKSVPAVFSSAESNTGQIPAGPHAAGIVVAQGPIVITDISNPNNDKSLDVTVIPVNYGKRHMQNIGAVLASGSWQWVYELLYAVGAPPVASVSSPAIYGSGRTTNFTPAIAVRFDTCEVRGENDTMNYTIAPCTTLQVQHRSQMTTVGSAVPSQWLAGIGHDVRTFLHIIGVPRRNN